MKIINYFILRRKPIFARSLWIEIKIINYFILRRTPIFARSLRIEIWQINNFKAQHFYSWRCFSVLLEWANAIKAWASAIKNARSTQILKKGFLHPTKCLERVSKYSYLVSIILNYHFLKQCLRICLCWSWILIALAHILIAFVHTLIALPHLNSTKKMHQLQQEKVG